MATAFRERASALPRDVLEGAVELRDSGQLPLLEHWSV